MIKMQTALLILTVFIACLYFSAKRKNDINHKLFSSMLIMGIVNLTFDIVTVYTVNPLEEVSPVVNRVCHDIFIGSLMIFVFLTFQYISVIIAQEMQEKVKFQNYRYVILAAFLLMLIFGKLDYCETEKGNYSYGMAAYACYLLIGAYLVLTVIYVIRYRSKLSQKKRILILIPMAVEIAVSVYQLFYPVSLISGFGIFLIMFSIYLIHESPDIQMAEELKEAKAKAEQANQAKSDFLAKPIDSTHLEKMLCTYLPKELLEEGMPQEHQDSSKKEETVSKDILDVDCGMGLIDGVMNES